MGISRADQGYDPREGMMKLFLVMVYGHNSRSVVRAESREQVIELLKSETTSDGRAAFPNVHPSKVETFELESSGSSEIIAFI